MTIRAPALDGRLVRGQVDRPEGRVVDVGDALVDQVAGVVDDPKAVPPSPTKCFAVAAAASWRRQVRRPGARG